MSGSIIGGGSIFQIDLFKLGGVSQPVRVIVKGKRLGLVAEVSGAHSMLIVTGCNTAQELDGITSSGIDWEFAVGIKGSAIVKTGSRLFKAVADSAATGLNWVAQESTKRLAQWAMDDLGVIKPGRQFNLIPTPLSIGVGAGIYYEWQTLHLLNGNIGWQYVSPKWYVDIVDKSVRLQMYDIPEQDGTSVKIAIGVDELGIDPYIRWKSERRGARISHGSNYQIIGYVLGGRLYEYQAVINNRGPSGIDLSKLDPVGDIDNGIVSVTSNSNIRKNSSLKIYPAVLEFGNYARWSGSNKLSVSTDSTGNIVNAQKSSKVRS